MLKRLRSISLHILSITLALLLAEGIYRYLRYEPRKLVTSPHFADGSWARPDATLGWVNRAGAYRSIEPGHEIMNFLPDGRRVDPIGPKPDADSNILVVGCSATQGYGVNDSEPYPHLLNEALSRTEVLNFGTAGYGTYQSLLRIRSYFRDKPARPTPLVIYGLYGGSGGHPFRDVAVPEWIMTALTTSDGRWFVPPHVRVGTELTERTGSPVDLWPFETRSAIVAHFHRLTIEYRYRSTPQQMDEALRRLVSLMDETVRREKSALLVVGLHQVPSWFEAWANEHDIDYQDCHDNDYDRMDPAARVGGVGHPNGRTHSRWVQCLINALSKRGFAPQISESGH